MLARCAQAATAVAAVADVFRAAAVRDHYLHATEASRHRSGLVSMAFVYLMTLAVVLFLVWLARSRRNAQELSPRAPLPGAAWTVGAWFVPVVNFFVPRRFVLDIGRASSLAWRETRDTMLVNLWWAAWVAHALVLAVANRADPGSMLLLVSAEALMITAAVLLGLVIERVTTLQAVALSDTLPAARLEPGVSP
ncbi:DUF4328 domain-containing protein [Streptomyces galbus]|nr:DUF4328 domain-containing protein [Streptomyces galbus]GHD52663.1 hypothetical protein GCM10010335_65370 [Streptomyces galbus]